MVRLRLMLPLLLPCSSTRFLLTVIWLWTKSEDNDGCVCDYATYQNENRLDEIGVENAGDGSRLQRSSLIGIYSSWISAEAEGVVLEQ